MYARGLTVFISSDISSIKVANPLLYTADLQNRWFCCILHAVNERGAPLWNKIWLGTLGWRISKKARRNTGVWKRLEQMNSCMWIKRSIFIDWRITMYRIFWANQEDLERVCYYPQWKHIGRSCFRFRYQEAGGLGSVRVKRICVSAENIV